MRAAHDLGMDFQRPVILGDQRINITVAQLGNGLKETFRDLVLQPSWPCWWKQVRQAREEALPFGSEYLNPFAILDPKLLIAAPVAFVKYPLSYVAKSPVASLFFFGLLFAADGASATSTADSFQPVNVFGDLFLSALETLVFARIFLKELLAERNEILAQNILEQCRLLQSPQPRWKRFFWDTKDVPYAPNSVKNAFGESTGKEVVAVLGMAHCNGVARLLKEERVQ